MSKKWTSHFCRETTNKNKQFQGTKTCISNSDKVVEDNDDFLTRFMRVSSFILIIKKYTSHFRRETTKVKYTVLRYKDMNILFILDQTKLSRFTLKIRHCAPSLHEGLLKIALRVPLIGLYSAPAQGNHLNRIFSILICLKKIVFKKVHFIYKRTSHIFKIVWYRSNYLYIKF